MDAFSFGLVGHTGNASDSSKTAGSTVGFKINSTKINLHKNEEALAILARNLNGLAKPCLN